MEKMDNILIVESECNIIKPICHKNKYNKQLSQESKNINNEQEKDEAKEPILEILNILNTSVCPNYKKRNIPDNNINQNIFNNELENNFKYIQDVNAYNKIEFSTISNITQTFIEIEDVTIN